MTLQDKKESRNIGCFNCLGVIMDTINTQRSGNYEIFITGRF